MQYIFMGSFNIMQFPPDTSYQFLKYPLTDFVFCETELVKNINCERFRNLKFSIKINKHSDFTYNLNISFVNIGGSF